MIGGRNTADLGLKWLKTLGFGGVRSGMARFGDARHGSVRIGEVWLGYFSYMRTPRQVPVGTGSACRGEAWMGRAGLFFLHANTMARRGLAWQGMA